MGGVSRSARHLRRLAPVAVLAAAALRAATPAAGSPAEGPAAYRLDLQPSVAAAGEFRFAALLERSVDGGRSWAPAPGEAISFAFVGQGAVVGLEGAAVAGMECTTPASGTCSITLRSDDPASSTLAAFAGEAGDSIPLRPGS